MGYRIVCDEHIRVATIEYLRKLGHNVTAVQRLDRLGPGTDDEEIADYSKETNRLVLTRDEDFLLQIDVERPAGILYQETSLRPTLVGEIVDEISSHVPQEDVTLLRISTNWL